ncbi:alpha/beta fold hydrolase [Rhizobium sp. L1K21]|uniref:alpha/beta fold hydrolase n=1 Tax=Rhizobium sp. L1K21 TaxID=2954933 RepID=UPI0020925FF6|nr:alpha/beta hydrolase [Rhizobium sp. L1K21]MCO6187241.1 alpha/beta hydrolase [Rhizobium sp. L1K21]
MTTLVLIPGLVSDEIIWKPLADAARPHMPVYDALPTDKATIPDMAASILEAVDGDLIAVGHSLGGRIAMELAHQAPERVKGLVLANTGHHPLSEGETPKRQQKIDLGNEDMAKLAAEWLPPMLDPARVSDTALVAELTAMVLRAGPEVHERQIRALMARPDAGAYLSDITCPVLLIAAYQDKWSPVSQHEEIAEALGGESDMAIIDNAGHFAPVEQPDAVVSATMGWLKRRFEIG